MPSRRCVASIGHPDSHAAPWELVSPDTALSREMKFICALQLRSESPASGKLDNP